MSAGRRARRLLLLLLLALLACAVSAGGESGLFCDLDLVTCGEGNCTQVPSSSPPTYECHCDPGWSRVVKDLLLSPCMIPDCSFDAACLNLSTPPKPTASVCAFVNCGEGGACKPDDSGLSSYSCECQLGYTNLLNKTALPCAKNDCFLGDSCSALGLGTPAPLAPSAPPPSGTKGSASSPSLLPLLLLTSIAMVVHQVL